MTRKSLLLGCALLGLAANPAAPQEKPSPPEQDLINFRAGYYDGCLKGQKALGTPQKLQEAHCSCMLMVLGEVPEPDLKVFMQRVTADASAALDPTFLAAMQKLGAADCALVGQFDDTKTLSKEDISQLRDPKVFDEFSIRLPRGFMTAPVQQQGPTRNLAFARLHADLETSTVILVATGDIPTPPPMESAPTLRGQVLKLLLGKIGEKLTEWTQSEPSEVNMGGLLFAAADWTGKSNGKGMKGTVYAAIKGSKIVSLSAQDVQPFADDTIPLAKEVFKTFSLR